MPEYTEPGVYIEELPSGSRPITGVSTSTAAFVGPTERGPLEPQLITSWQEYQRWYGRHLGDASYLAYAVEGFFANGGQRCYIARVTGDGAAYNCGRLGDSINVVAIGPGTWSASIALKVTYATAAIKAWLARNEENPDLPPHPAENWFKVTAVYYQAGEVVAQETYDNLSHDPGAENNAAKQINASSHLIRTWWESMDPPTLPALAAGNVANIEELSIQVTWAGGADDPPQAKHFRGTNGVACPPVPTPSGAHVPAPPDLLGLPDQPMGLAALEPIDEISLLVAPDEVNGQIMGARQISTAVIEQCEKRYLRDRFALISAGQGISDITHLQPPQDTSFAAFYYPWIKVFDPSVNTTRLVPATGHIAGIFARTDIERGVHKAPANAVIRGVLDLEYLVNQVQQAILNPRGVNCLRDFRSSGRGIRLWGARTMSSDPEWRYVNVRRYFLYLEESIDEGTRWAVFEPNSETLWANVRRSIEDFLFAEWRKGALVGTTPEKAFFVRCDRTTMTQNDLDKGHLICIIGVAPLRPAEFVIFRISQQTAANA